MKLHALALGLTLALSTGCASLTGPRFATLSVTSNPPGADVRVNGAPAGRTPLALPLAKEVPPMVEVGMPGYQTQVCPVRMAPAGGYVAADVVLCILLFPIGCVSFIDAGGAWNELSPPYCNVALQPATGGGPPVPPPGVGQPYGTPPQGQQPPPPPTM